MYTFFHPLFTISALSALTASYQDSAVWQPAVGTEWQIEIWTQVDTSQSLSPAQASIYDVDLFYHTKDQIAVMKGQGKKIICYFSAGSAEIWRPDYNEFNSSDIGEPLEGWAGERYLNIKSSAVLEVMKKRIQLAATKGCDAIDPDNMDGYSNGGGGFDLQESDAIKYLQNMAAEAKNNHLATGLKNAQEILPSVLSDIQFAVNEECATEGSDGCQEYDDLLAAGKPVFHIEYVNTTSSGQWTNPSFPGVSNSQMLVDLCVKKQSGGISGKLSTVIKDLDLDGWVVYCDGSQYATAINSSYDTGDPKQAPPARLVF